jgi:hypothetical protein
LSCEPHLSADYGEVGFMDACPAAALGDAAGVLHMIDNKQSARSATAVRGRRPRQVKIPFP